jgi:hypothetical protein
MTDIATQGATLSDLVKMSYVDSDYYVETVTARESAETTYSVGMALGKVSAGTAVAAAGAGNTGNGTMGAVTVGSQAQAGVYVLEVTGVDTDAGDFRVTSPTGELIGVGDVASAFTSGHISFTLADGAADFVVGDIFNITVTLTSTKYKVAVETATDGSKAVSALFVGDMGKNSSVVIPANTDTTVQVIVRGPVKVSKGGIVLDATYDNDTKKNVVYASLAALNPPVIVADEV